jgi:DNA repair protein RadA/Sms
MLLAVLETRCGLRLGANDVYLNVAGGLRIQEPAADLAVAAAIVSALSATPMPADMVAFGEIGLSGEVRMVGQGEARLKEAAKLGFARAVTPRRRQERVRHEDAIALSAIDHVAELLPLLGLSRRPVPAGGGT